MLAGPDPVVAALAAGDVASTQPDGCCLESASRSSGGSLAQLHLRCGAWLRMDGVDWPGCWASRRAHWKSKMALRFVLAACRVRMDSARGAVGRFRSQMYISQWRRVYSVG